MNLVKFNSYELTPEVDELTLPSAAEFVATMLQSTEPQFDEQNASMTYLDSMSVELPIELQVEDVDARTKIRMSAPTQRTLTSVYPVLHKIRFTLGAELI